jgi:hypothetical protein
LFKRIIEMTPRFRLRVGCGHSFFLLRAKTCHCLLSRGRLNIFFDVAHGKGAIMQRAFGHPSVTPINISVAVDGGGLPRLLVA